jgi:hypothetical protein
MKYVKIRGVEIALPSPEQWSAAIASGQLDGSPLASPRVTSSWLDGYSHVPDAVLGAQKRIEKWWAIPLLHIDGAYYPVHFEDVICNQCNKRGGLSACPDTISIWWLGRTAADAWALFEDFPILNCPHCQSPLTHRQTIWFAPGFS